MDTQIIKSMGIRVHLHSVAIAGGIGQYIRARVLFPGIASSSIPIIVFSFHNVSFIVVQIYLVTFATQGLSVAMFYFEISVTREEFGENSKVSAVNTSVGSDMDMHAMSFRRPAGTKDIIPGESDPSQHSKIRISEETAIMRPVAWDDANKNPEGEANFISRLLFLWIGPLFKYAHTHTIEDVDLWDLRVKLRCLIS